MKSFGRQWLIEQDTPYHFNIFKIQKRLMKTQTKFQRIDIVELDTMGTALLLDGRMQSCAYDEQIYHEILVHPALLSHPSPKRILILGGGEMATLREVLKHSSVERVVMVDIDEELVKFFMKHLPNWHMGVYKDPRAQLIYDDGRKYLEETKEMFDVIISDLVDPFDSPASLLYTTEFYTLAKKHLTSQGIFCTQADVIPYSVTDPDLSHLVITKTLSSVFRHVHPMHQYLPSFTSDWGFAMATDTIDLLAISDTIYLERIKKRVQGGLSFLTGESIKNLFTFSPIFHRIKGDSHVDIFTDKRTGHLVS